MEALSPKLHFMTRKKTRRWIALLCAAMLVWSQFAVAAYACPQLVSLIAPAAAAEMPADCAAGMNAKPSPLCKAHCAQSAQSSQTPSIDIPPLALASLWLISPFATFEPSPARAIHDRPMWLAAASPPLRIQFQVFRN